MSQHHQYAQHAETWMPRADMAALIRKSPDTVRRTVEKHGLGTRTDDAGRALVNVADFLDLGLLRLEDLTPGTTPAESVEVLRARETIAGLRETAAELQGRLGHADAFIDTLRDQLSVKDRQLTKQGEQLTQLIARLGMIGGAA